MGSPEKCDKCGGVGSHVEGKRGFTRFPCPNATTTPPAPAEVCAFCGITTTDAEPSDGTKYVCRDRQPCIDRARKACGLPPKPAPADAKCNAPGCSVCAAGLPHTTHSYPMTAPAPADAVEEAMAPGCHEHVALWDAINAYSVACGGHPTRGGGARMDAVARVEKALRAALRREKESRSDDSRPASGQGGA